MLMKKIQFLIILIIANFAVSAQTKQISGKVSSSDNNSPLQGVTVSLKNSNTRTITNKDGLFTISADKSEEEELVDVGVYHAVTHHGHTDSPQLREEIRKTISSE